MQSMQIYQQNDMMIIVAAEVLYYNILVQVIVYETLKTRSVVGASGVSGVAGVGVDSVLRIY